MGAFHRLSVIDILPRFGVDTHMANRGADGRIARDQLFIRNQVAEPDIPPDFIVASARRLDPQNEPVRLLSRRKQGFDSPWAYQSFQRFTGASS